jgi:hypothetical protein
MVALTPEQQNDMGRMKPAMFAPVKGGWGAEGSDSRDAAEGHRYGGAAGDEDGVGEGARGGACGTAEKEEGLKAPLYWNQWTSKRPCCAKSEKPFTGSR